MVFYGKIHELSWRLADISKIVDFYNFVSDDNRVIYKIDGIEFRSIFDKIVELVKLLGKISYFFNISQSLELSIGGYLAFDGKVLVIVALLVIFVEAMGIEVLGDLVEIVLSSLGEVDIGVFLVVLLLFGLRVIAIFCIFFLLFCFLFFVLVSGWRLCFLKEEFMFVVPGFYLFV